MSVYCFFRIISHLWRLILKPEGMIFIFEFDQELFLIIIAYIIIPWINGFTTKDFITFFDNPAPIKNNVMVNPVSAAQTMCSEKNATGEI